MELRREKDVLLDRSFESVQRDTESKLVDLFKDFKSFLANEKKIDDGKECDRSLRLFHEWLMKFMNDDLCSYPFKYYFVSVTVDEHLDYVNDKFDGMTQDQASIVDQLRHGIKIIYSSKEKEYKN